MNELRERFPQYADLSDIELAEAIHKKYYADIPWDDFAQRIGLAPDPPTPVGTGSPLSESVKDAGSVVAQAFGVNNPVTRWMTPEPARHVLDQIAARANEVRGRPGAEKPAAMLGHGSQAAALGSLAGRGMATGLARRAANPHGFAIRTGQGAGARLAQAASGAKGLLRLNPKNPLAYYGAYEALKQMGLIGNQ